MTREQFFALSDQAKWDAYLLLESELNAAEAALALYKAEPELDKADTRRLLAAIEGD